MSHVIEVRPAIPADALGLCQLTEEVAAEGAFIVPDRLFFSEAQQAAVLTHRDPAYHQIWVGCDGPRVVCELEVVRGVWRKTQHTATLAVVVAKSHRGTGLFSRCLEAAQGWARDQQVEKLCLTVFATNTGARTAYQRRGFVEEGVRRGQYRLDSALVDEVLMAQWLTPSGRGVDGSQHGP